jgi:putative endonuclease
MPHKEQYWVYIMTNRWRTVLYVGVTNNIIRRVSEHKSGQGGVFTRKYNIVRLVYIETTDNVRAAIEREKQIKAGSREKKIGLINSINPDWNDLSEEE